MIRDQVHSPPNQETHFLVSGGGKGITAENAAALAKVYRSRFTLLGRSKILSEEPAWAVSLEDEKDLKLAALEHHQDKAEKISPREIGSMVSQIISSREIKRTLKKISDNGGSAEYISIDITDPEDLKEKLLGRLESINALLHGAGALADKFIEDKTESDFDLVYGVKVGGLRNILQLISAKQLDYLILFSSVAGFYGNAGQADYSISNEVLNKLAHHIKLTHPSCQVMSIGWGPWDGGMVTPQLKRILTRRKVPLISLESGTQALVDLLENPSENPQFVIGAPLPYPARKLSDDLKEYRIKRQLNLEENLFLRDHVIGGHPVLPTVCAVGWIINSSKALYPGLSYFRTSDYRAYKGIVFDKESPSEYILELNELEKSSEGVVILGKISSQTAEGKVRYHYQAKVELRKVIPDRPRINEFNLEADEPITGKSLYESKILFHGPRFQGVEEVLNISPTGMTTRCRLEQFPATDFGQFPIKEFDPYLADVHLQSLLIWSHFNTGSVGLPLQIAEGIQYQQVRGDNNTYVTMHVKASNSHKLVADVISHDQDGLIFSKVTDAEITLNENLYDLFKMNQLETEPAWIS